MGHRPGAKMQITTKSGYKAAVIGAGPAGLACIGNLLDLLAEKGSKEKILWVDPEFGSGRLAAYPLVPSNTKVNLFTKFALECRSFDAHNSSLTFRNLLDNFDGLKGCHLKWASEMCKELTAALLKREQIDIVRGRVQVLERSKSDRIWRIETDKDQNFESELVFLATGSAPKSLQNIPGQTIHLDDALNPEVLSTQICTDDIIGVYGSSHSAMLVLKNLLINCTVKAKLIVNYYRKNAKFAEYPDPINCPDKILHDNTGLKGEVADWVRTWNDLSPEDLKKFFNNALMRIKLNNNNINDTNINGDYLICNKNIFAVGYARNPLPTIIYDSIPINPDSIDYDSLGNLQICPQNQSIDALYGYGIAFPEKVIDLTGEEEMAVGLWKFMKHVKRSLGRIVI